MYQNCLTTDEVLFLFRNVLPYNLVIPSIKFILKKQQKSKKKTKEKGRKNVGVSTFYYIHYILYRISIACNPPHSVLYQCRKCHYTSTWK